MTRLRVRALGPSDRADALACLEAAPRLNLHLIDLVARIGAPSRRGEPRSEVVGAWRGDALVSLLSISPSVVLDARVGADAALAFLPYLGGANAGLLKSTEDVVGPVWEGLAQRGRQVLLDRIENAFAVEARDLRPAPVPPGLSFRPARPGDVDALVVASRESLIEEDRPDPSRRDPAGFRRWVRSRIPRAFVGERDGALVFVGYADVRCPQGWLLQGIFTWREARKQGIASAGVSELCRRAFAAHADHVQLAVVDGNEAAERLYAGLGFERFARLRTLLFS